jgi:hypothetical protein
MAAHRDLPGWLGPPDSPALRWRTNLVGVLGVVLVGAWVGAPTAVALSACCALVYYALVCLAALRLPAAQRAWPRWTSTLGLPLCVGLAVVLPRIAVLVAGPVLVLGWLASTLAARRAGPFAAEARVPRPRQPAPLDRRGSREPRRLGDIPPVSDPGARPAAAREDRPPAEPAAVIDSRPVSDPAALTDQGAVSEDGAATEPRGSGEPRPPVGEGG